VKNGSARSRLKADYTLRNFFIGRVVGMAEREVWT